MSFAALAKRAKAVSTAQPALESQRQSSRDSAISHDVNRALDDKMESTPSEGNQLKLPRSNSTLPEHPSTLKSRPTSKTSSAKPNSALIERIKAQIAKEDAEEKDKMKEENPSATDAKSSPPSLPMHLRTKEGTESIGNTDCVNCFTLFNNGEFASGSGDGHVLIWNEGTGEVIQVLQNHQGPVLSMTTDAPGRSLITASSDMSLRKWGLTRPLVVQDLEYMGHTRWVQSVAVHNDFVFSASLDKTVRQWDLHSGKCNFIFAGHSDWVSSLCVHNETLYTGSWDGFVRLWNISTWECTHLFEGHTGPILAICLDVTHAQANPSFIFSASQDGTVKRWCLTNYVEAGTYAGHILGVSAIDCSSALLASGSFDSTIRLYDLSAAHPLHVLHGHEDSVTCVKLSKDDHYLYSSSDDYTIRKWDCKTGLCLRIYGIPKSQQLIAGLGTDGKRSGGSLSLLLNFGDDDDPSSLRARIRRILREEENESILLEHEFCRRLELYRNRLLADRLKEKSEGKAKNDASVVESTSGNDAFEDSVVIDLKDDFLNQRYGLIAVYSDAKEALRDDVLECTGLGASAVQLLWENKQEGLKVAWLDSKFKKAAPAVAVSASDEICQLDQDYAANLAVLSILEDVLVSALLQTADGIAESVLNGILDCIDPPKDPGYDATPEGIAEDVLKGILDCIVATLTPEGIAESVLNGILDCIDPPNDPGYDATPEGIAADILKGILDFIVATLTPEGIAESVLNGILDCIDPPKDPGYDATPEGIAADVLKGILDLVCFVQPEAAANVSTTQSFQKPVFDASAASIDVSDVSLADVLSPQLIACLNSILHRANRRYHRSKAVFNTKFFESAMTQADERDRRLQILQASLLDMEERKMLMQQEETRFLALVGGEAREIHTILTQVASEIDRLVSDHRQLWFFKFSGLISDSQWKQLDFAVAELIRKHQLKSDEIYEEFDRFFSDAASKDLPLSDIEERCEQVNHEMAELQRLLDEELIRVLTTFPFVTPELLAQMRTIFGRDAGAVMLQFKLEVDRQQKRIVDDALERARQEDIQKEEMARLNAKRLFKENRQREVEAAKLAKIESMKALEFSRTKQKLDFEVALTESAKSEDFSDLEDAFFVFAHRVDLRRRPVLILKMANFPLDPCLEGRPQFEDFDAPSEQWQRRIVRFVIMKLDSILDAPDSTYGDVSRYLLVVDFTESSPRRRPSIVFLQQTWHMLPDRVRLLMGECIVVNTPFWFIAFVWFLKPLVSPRVWKKVRFVKSYSDLWGLLSHADLCNISSTDKNGNKKLAFSGDPGISGKSSFLSMLSRARTAHLIKGQDSLEFFEKYFDIINGAKVADWSEIMDLHFLDTSGVDISGRPVIMFIASNFPCKLGDSFLNRCLVYIMLRVHELMFEQKKNVSILVVCSNITTQNIPSTTWLQMAAKKFPYRIRKMIQCIYVLNPGFLVKKALWALRSIVSPKVSNKVIEVETILQLLRYFNHKDLKLPQSVLQDVPFGGTPEEMKVMMAEIRDAMKRGHDAGLDQKVDFSQQFKLGVTAPTDHDIETLFTLICKDFEDINGKDILKFAGRDIAKRPVVSITLANIPAAKGEIAMNKVFRLVVLLLQPLSQFPYSIAIIATRFVAANSPSIDWMKDVHKSIDSSARKNLRAVYLFEPTFLVKSVTFGLQSFVSSKFFRKVFLITDSDDFYQHIDPSHCKLPKALMSQYLRVSLAPVAPSHMSATSTAAMPPQFAAIPSSRFTELQGRTLADFGDQYDELAQVSGIDIFGDPIIVVDGSKVDTTSEEAFVSTLFYLLALAKENVNDDESFSVAYCDDDLNDKTPSSDWLRGAYTLIPKHLRKNIKHLFCINSSQSLRMFFWFANTFVSAKFAQKVVHIMDTADLAEFLDTRETKLPPEVLKRLPQADAKKMSLAMVRRSRALMSHRLVPQAAAPSPQSPAADLVAQESSDSARDIIQVAHSADKTAATELDCLYLSKTLEGLPCVMIQVCKLPDDQYPQYREVMTALFMLLIVSIDSASKMHADAKYCLFLSNVDSSSENRPSMEWLRTFHAQLPHQMRKNCAHVFIYLPSLAMRAFLGTARLFLSSKFFKKIVNLTSESAAAQHFDTFSDGFRRVSGQFDGANARTSRISSRVSRSRTLTASEAGRAAVEASQSSVFSETPKSDEQPQVVAEPKHVPPHQPLVTKFRNVTGKPVVRTAVPLGQVPWAVPFSAYAPTVFTSEGFPGSVRSSIRSAKNPLGQADPENIHDAIHGLNATFFDELRASEESIQSIGLADSIACTALGIAGRLRFSYTGKISRNDKGYPLNPSGRTGLGGRAHLMLWGANHRALPVIARCSRGDREQHMQLLMTKIPATDSAAAEWALPDSSVPAGHCISPQLLKGLEDQALSRVDLFDDLTQQEVCGQFQNLFGPGRVAPDNVKRDGVLHAGVWDHPGNTDHAWSEAVSVLVLVEDRMALSLDNGSGNLTWVPYDQSMPVKESHKALISEAVLQLSQRGVCDIHGNVSSGYGGFSLSSSLAGLEKAVTSVFTMDSFPGRTIKQEQEDYEELERSDGLYAESTVEARRGLVVRYRKAGNISAAKALEALDRTDVAGGVESFPEDGAGGALGSSAASAAAAAGSTTSGSVLHKEDIIQSMMRLYQTRQLCKELSDKGRFDEAAELRSQSMSYDPQ